MDSESILDITYRLSPKILSSIKSVDSIAVFGTGAPLELPLALFEVLMAFAEKKTPRQAFEMLHVDVDLPRFGALIHEFSGRGLLMRDAPVDEGDGLRQFLGHRVFGDPMLANKLTGAMRQGRMIIIPDALPMDLAGRAHQELDWSRQWTIGEGGHDFFHYRNGSIEYLETRGGALAECSRLFRCSATRRFVSEISGQDCAGEAQSAAAWYRAGEYALPHDDSDSRMSRSVAYIWYLTKEWRQEWGGALFWCPTGQYISPRFNVLVMFNVLPSNLHFVCPVAPSAVSKRLTINGFWHTSQPRQPAASISPEAWISPAAYRPQLREQPDLLPIIVP
jgi:hypothetical protein